MFNFLNVEFKLFNVALNIDLFYLSENSFNVTIIFLLIIVINENIIEINYAE